MVFSADEEPHIQAIGRSAPVLPMVPGTPERRSRDYHRHGTSDFFAALNVATGKLSAQHRAVDLRDFLDEIFQQVEPGLEVHMICDYLSIHKAPVVQSGSSNTRRTTCTSPRLTHRGSTVSVRRVTGQPPRSWRVLLPRRTHHRAAGMAQALNENARPSTWTKNADQIIDAIGRCCAQIPDQQTSAVSSRTRNTSGMHPLHSSTGRADGAAAQAL